MVAVPGWLTLPSIRKCADVNREGHLCCKRLSGEHALPVVGIWTEGFLAGRIPAVKNPFWRKLYANRRKRMAGNELHRVGNGQPRELMGECSAVSYSTPCGASTRDYAELTQKLEEDLPLSTSWARRARGVGRRCLGIVQRRQTAGQRAGDLSYQQALTFIRRVLTMTCVSSGMAASLVAGQCYALWGACPTGRWNLDRRVPGWGNPSDVKKHFWRNLYPNTRKGMAGNELRPVGNGRGRELIRRVPRRQLQQAKRGLLHDLLGQEVETLCGPRYQRDRQADAVPAGPQVPRRAAGPLTAACAQVPRGRSGGDHAYHDALTILAAQRSRARLGLYCTYEQTYGPDLSRRAGMPRDHPREEELR